MKSISSDLPHVDDIYLWLIFDEESTVRCRKIIERLAKQYQSVSFTPHITLSATPNWTKKQISSAIDEIVVNCSVLELSTTSIRCSSNPYQKLTHGIQITNELTGLHIKTDSCFKGNFANKAYPHISYLYSNRNCTEVAQEIEMIQNGVPQHIGANRLALVQCKGTPELWRMLNTWELRF